MKSLKAICLCCLTAAIILAIGVQAATAREPVLVTSVKQTPAQTAPQIQLAILLDTSGSMRGLINQARTQLWKIVNELATAKQDGQVPHMQVALYEYGKSSLPASENYLRQIVPLTDDLDRISEQLFALKTNGGEEYCGAVIDAATRSLQWSDSPKALKLIFIAGNEPFTQGGIDYKSACSQAIAKGITVNTIFCGPENVGQQTGWLHGAQLADGSFSSIDHNQAVAQVATPYDKRLAELSSKVNSTFVYYGRKATRESLSRRQVAADRAATTAAPAAAAERARFKVSKQYQAAASDLVQALADGRVKLDSLKEQELPEELRKLSREKQVELLTKKSKERLALQNEIQDLSKKRQAFIAKARDAEAKDGKPETFDTAIIGIIRKQAESKSFRFNDDK